MRLALLAAVLLLPSPARSDGDESWRWQSRWALVSHFDISEAQGEPSAQFEQEVNIERSARGFPSSLRGSTLRVCDEGVLRIPRRGEPELFVEHRGGTAAAVLGLALGDRGLLLLVDEPSLGGRATLELRYRPAHEYPFRIGHPPRVRTASDARGHAIMSRAGCFSCHSLHGQRQVGPSLDRESLVPRLTERLASAAYRERIAGLDRDDGPGLARWREARAEVLNAAGADRSRVWMRWHLTESRFDHPQARMPSMGLDREQVVAVVEFLLGTDDN